jgi:hypothetical protein
MHSAWKNGDHHLDAAILDATVGCTVASDRLATADADGRDCPEGTPEVMK